MFIENGFLFHGWRLGVLWDRLILSQIILSIVYWVFLFFKRFKVNLILLYRGLVYLFWWYILLLENKLFHQGSSYQSRNFLPLCVLFLSFLDLFDSWFVCWLLQRRKLNISNLWRRFFDLLCDDVGGLLLFILLFLTLIDWLLLYLLLLLPEVILFVFKGTNHLHYLPFLNVLPLFLIPSLFTNTCVYFWFFTFIYLILGFLKVVCLF